MVKIVRRTQRQIRRIPNENLLTRYQALFDPIEPLAEKGVYPTAAALGAGAALAYTVNSAATHIAGALGPESVDHLTQALDSHSTLEAGLKLVAYAGLYGTAAYFGAKPIASIAKSVGNERRPSLARHIATWGTAAMLTLGLYGTGVHRDIKDAYHATKKGDLVATVAQIADEHLSGARIESLVERMWSEREEESIPAEIKNGKDHDLTHPEITRKKLSNVRQGNVRMIDQVYGQTIDTAIAKYDNRVTRAYVEGVIGQESQGSSCAISDSKCKGIGQFTRDTAKAYGLKIYKKTGKKGTYWVDERNDPSKAVPAVVHYLSDLNKQYQNYTEGDLFALGAYNAGPGLINRAIELTGKEDPSWAEVQKQITLSLVTTMYGATGYFQPRSKRAAKVEETRAYVPFVLSHIDYARTLHTSDNEKIAKR